MRTVLHDSCAWPTTAVRVTLGSAEPDQTNPGKRIDSLDEFQWQEVVVDLHKLPNYYLMLSKIRLTSMCVGLLVCLLVFWFGWGVVVGGRGYECFF